MHSMYTGDRSSSSFFSIQSHTFQQEVPCRAERCLLKFYADTFPPCVSSGSGDGRLPPDSGSLVTGGGWPAATDPGGQCCRPCSCLLIPVQVSQTVKQDSCCLPFQTTFYLLFSKMYHYFYCDIHYTLYHT